MWGGKKSEVHIHIENCGEREEISKIDQKVLLNM